MNEQPICSAPAPAHLEELIRDANAFTRIDEQFDEQIVRDANTFTHMDNDKQVYITKATFKRITFDYSAPKDHHFSDTLIWKHNCGYYISQEEAWIFGQWETNELLVFKSLCKNSQDEIKKFRKIEKPKDSWLYIQPEQSPRYHKNKECASMQSTLSRIFIPEQIRDRAKNAEEDCQGAGRKIIDEYRKYWRELEKEFESKYGDDWRTNEDRAQSFAYRINMHYKLNPPLKDFDIEERDNSGTTIIDNRSAQEISDNILYIINELLKWANENPKRAEMFVHYASRSFLGNYSDDIYGLWTGDNQDDVKKLMRYIHQKKLLLMNEIKELYIRSWIPELKFEESFLKQLGLEPCWNCIGPATTGEEVYFNL